MRRMDPREAAAIEAESLLLEGEAIMINEAGLSDFHAPQAVTGLRRPPPKRDKAEWLKPGVG